MTRWAIVADLNRCVGCQTCTSACKHENATAPGVQWRKVLDFETGTFPDVSRAFLPVGCMHCDNPSCMEVCPSTATRKRDDGIVTIDYDLCIGCSYCAVSCPYQARFKVNQPAVAYDNKPMRHETLREDPARLGVAQKCTLCVDRIDEGLANGLVPGVDTAATPACVASCISGALQMGDLDDPDSNVSHLLRERRHFVMHEELGNGPAIHYLYDGEIQDAEPHEPPEMVAEPVGLATVSSRLQTSWDWRAAANFMLGGSGTGLMAVAMLAGFFMPMSFPAVFLALAMVGLGLFCVLLEIGRKLRFLNVFRNPHSSWMSREALAAVPFMGLGGLAWLVGVTGAGQGASFGLGLGAAAFGLAFLYSQARILRAAKGIPAWRQPGIVTLIVMTGLTEGAGLFALIATVGGVAGGPSLAGALALLVVLRFLAWRQYRSALGATGAPVGAFRALDGLHLGLWHGLGVVLALGAALALPGSALTLALAGLAAVARGWLFKVTLITRAALNQGYAINRMPARGAGKSGPGIKPGWMRS